MCRACLWKCRKSYTARAGRRQAEEEVQGLTLKDTEFQNEEAGFHDELLKTVEEQGDMTRDELYIHQIRHEYLQ